MRKVLIMPFVAVALFAAACDGGGDSTGPSGPSANARFINATTGMSGSGGFTTNGQFASGSALASGQSTPTCSRVSAGTASLGFGPANAGGNGLDGNALATLSSQSLSDGGDYIVAATGSATSPTLFLLDQTFTGTLASNQAAVRFVNLAPGRETTANTYIVWWPAIAPGVSPMAINIAVGAPTEYRAVASGAGSFTVAQNPGHAIVVPSGTATLAAGSVNTFAIVPSGAAGGVRVIHLPRCS